MNVTGPLALPVLGILGQQCWTVLGSSPTLLRLCSVSRMLLELAMTAGPVSAGLLSGCWGMDTVRDTKLIMNNNKLSWECHTRRYKLS